MHGIGAWNREQRTARKLHFDPGLHFERHFRSFFRCVGALLNILCSCYFCLKIFKLNWIEIRGGEAASLEPDRTSIRQKKWPSNGLKTQNGPQFWQLPICTTLPSGAFCKVPAFTRWFVRWISGWRYLLSEPQTLLSAQKWSYVFESLGLQSLHVWVFDDLEKPPVVEAPPLQIVEATVPSSLRRLHYEYEHTGILDPYLHLLLQRHADTLEVVSKACPR